MRHSHILPFIFCIVMSFIVVGCATVELHQNLSEEDANEILVLLSENGIKAHKNKEVRQNVVSYAIEVPKIDMVRARSLLVKHNLPRRRELGLTGVYKEKGLIPTPDEQKARFLLALKGEIINSLERIPQIVDADVVLNVPTRDEFADPGTQHLQRPTASVVIRVKPDTVGSQAITEAKVQQFVANAVEGLNPRDVTVMISYYIPGREAEMRPDAVKSLPAPVPDIAKPAVPSPAVTQELIGLTLDEASKGRLKIYLLVFFLILVLLAVALIVVIVQGSRIRHQLAVFKGHAGERPAVEGRVLDEGPPGLPEGPPPPE